MARTAVVVPAFGDWSTTDKCLRSIEATAPDAPVVVIDNGPEPKPVSAPWPMKVYHANLENVGFARACNQGFDLAVGLDVDVVVFLNNDTIVHTEWLSMLAGEFAAPDVGAAGCRLVYPDHTLQHAGVEIIRHITGQVEARNVKRERRPGDVSAVTGACMAVRVDAFEQVGGFDVNYWNGYEDVDLCLKLREAGWRIRYTDRATVTHLESASGPERWSRVRENEQRLTDKWG